ncbi:class I adenylate-forming enzyme family protein [Nocardia jiangxiensis]|uniref:class I adenylate-forming enzyme family protein n=1 Tax=Nocardia jiangxiensis TaxID=282685 RepID=UPI0002E6F0AC|nr:class I adenylate-forming enzyme family protein [Nocardia jiangxiensis]
MTETTQPLTPNQIHQARDKITGPGQFCEVDTLLLAGNEYRAFKHAPATVIDILDGARAHGDADFLVYEDQRYSYKRFFDGTDALAAALQSSYGIVRGDRVAIAMRNSPEWMIAFAAATLVGAIVVPINSWGNAEDLTFALADCTPQCIIIDQHRHQLLPPHRTHGYHVIVTDVADPSPEAGYRSFGAVVAEFTYQPYTHHTASAEDPAVILYTSGSTGFPKGAVHRHAAICQSLMAMIYLGLLLLELEGPREHRGGATTDSPILTVPLFHATGLISGLLMPAYVGQKVVLLRKWNAQAALRAIETEQVTILSTVPTILLDLLGHPEFDNYNTTTLSRVASAGTATPPGLPELIEKKLGRVSRSSGYGMTETMGVGATMSGAVFDLQPLSAGYASPIMEFRFVDAEGKVNPAGTGGEIQLRGITCSPAYWGMPSADLLTDDGWLRTGDDGYLDRDNYLHVTGRIKEIVIRGGENIHPAEIESVAHRHPAVREVAVFGVDDGRMGEELAMVYVLQANRTTTADQIRQFLTKHLPPHKMPKFLTESPHPLPRNASEKVHKPKVKAMFHPHIDTAATGPTMAATPTGVAGATHNCASISEVP